MTKQLLDKKYAVIDNLIKKFKINKIVTSSPTGVVTEFFSNQLSIFGI